MLIINVEAVMIPDRKPHAILDARLHNGFGVFEVGRERLLTEHVFARLSGEHSGADVIRVWGGNEHGVHLTIGKTLGEIVVRWHR